MPSHTVTCCCIHHLIGERLSLSAALGEMHRDAELVEREGCAAGARGRVGHALGPLAGGVAKGRWRKGGGEREVAKGRWRKGGGTAGEENCVSGSPVVLSRRTTARSVRIAHGATDGTCTAHGTPDGMRRDGRRTPIVVAVGEVPDV